MRKYLLCNLLLVFMGFCCHAQINFDKGYYINNSGQKSNVLIKDQDWKNNPDSFQYKLAEEGEPATATIENVKEFGIYNRSRYVRADVNIDRSASKIKALTSTSSPNFKEEKLFLKVIVQGKANLYMYEGGGLVRFFYDTENSKIEQLIHKAYLTPENKIGYNNRYKQQLWTNLNCEEMNLWQVKNLEYERRDLVKYFREYNNCRGYETVVFERKRRDLFNLGIRPGVTLNSLIIVNNSSRLASVDFGQEVGFRLGVEAEFIMPFNRNKWAFIVEPTYQYFKSEKEISLGLATADYTSIELPIGVRHYFFLNNSSKIFINGSFIFDFSGNSLIDYENRTDLELKSGPNMALGIGYNMGNNLSLEARYGTSREILANYLNWRSEYDSLSLILGYTIF